MPTISDVAQATGVSIKTVSRVINGEHYVAEATRARVLAAMQELGYVANVSAQRLAKGRARAIALVFHNPSWQYIGTVLQGVLTASRAVGYETVMHPCNIDDPVECANVVQLTRQGKVDGLVITPPCDVVESMMRALAETRVPFIRMTPCERSEGLPFVAADDYGGACAMTEYLIALGHRRIGFVVGSAVQIASGHRLAGYRHALAAAGLEQDPALVKQGDFNYGSGLVAGEDLLRSANRPTAIFASNDDMAAGVLAAAHPRGLSVPRDLSVAGFDDAPLSWQLSPALTTVHQPVYESAVLATQLLIDMLNGETPKQTANVLPTWLVERASTAPPLERSGGSRFQFSDNLVPNIRDSTGVAW
jgi:LacI family transcriptional regulator